MGKLFKKVPFGSNILLVFFLSSTVTVTKQFNSNRRRKRTQSCSFAHGPQCFKSKRVSFLGRSDTGGGCFSCGGGGAGVAGSGLGC